MSKQQAIHNHGYFALAFSRRHGDYRTLTSSPTFPSTFSLIQIADAALAWAQATPGAEAFQLRRHFPGEHGSRAVGCLIILCKEEQCNVA